MRAAIQFVYSLAQLWLLGAWQSSSQGSHGRNRDHVLWDVMGTRLQFQFPGLTLDARS
jgi:hypothetical protein